MNEKTEPIRIPAPIAATLLTRLYGKYECPPFVVYLEDGTQTQAYDFDSDYFFEFAVYFGTFIPKSKCTHWYRQAPDPKPRDNLIIDTSRYTYAELNELLFAVSSESSFIGRMQDEGNLKFQNMTALLGDLMNIEFELHRNICDHNYI